jgi:hypothetical protein
MYMKNCATQPETCIVGYTGGQVQHRGWLNLKYMWNDGTSRTDEDPTWPRATDPNADANVLKDWMVNGCQDCPFLEFGDFIHAKPGSNASAVGAAPVGETIVIPIFDYVPHYDDIADPKPENAAQGGDFYYHIVGFMAFKVTAENQGQGRIDGEVVQIIWADGQVGYGDLIGFGEGNACRTHAQAVNLWR